MPVLVALQEPVELVFWVRHEFAPTIDVGQRERCGPFVHGVRIAEVRVLKGPEPTTECNVGIHVEMLAGERQHAVGVPRVEHLSERDGVEVGKVHSRDRCPTSISVGGNGDRCGCRIHRGHSYLYADRHPFRSGLTPVRVMPRLSSQRCWLCDPQPKASRSADAASDNEHRPATVSLSRWRNKTPGPANAKVPRGSGASR